jgi:hypothetical protein
LHSSFNFPPQKQFVGEKLLAHGEKAIFFCSITIVLMCIVCMHALYTVNINSIKSMLKKRGEFWNIAIIWMQDHPMIYWIADNYPLTQASFLSCWLKQDNHDHSFELLRFTYILDHLDHILNLRLWVTVGQSYNSFSEVSPDPFLTYWGWLETWHSKKDNKSDKCIWDHF